MHKIFNTLLLCIRSQKDRTEKEIPIAIWFSHGKLQSTNSWLPASMSGKSLPSWCPQEILKQKYHSIASACSLCSWPHIHMVTLPQQLLPVCHHKHVSNTHTIQSATLLLSLTHGLILCLVAMHISKNFPPWNICVLLLVTRPQNCCHMK